MEGNAMKMHLEWYEDMTVLHICWRSGGVSHHVEVRGARSIFTADEDVGDPIVMLISSLPRRALDRSALMADEVVGVRRDAIGEVLAWLDWHERVTCWFDGQWIGK